MLTYAALNIVVLALLGLALVMWPQKLSWKGIGVILPILLAMTAVFDSLLVASHIVAYHSPRTLGLFIGKAPVEDFAYTLAVVFLVPYLWEHYATKD
jgi:lycopene cyclase domain-containing protein